MQFRDLGAQYNALKPAINAGIQEVIDNHAFINGAQVKELELMLTEYVGVKHCIACASGTDALILPLMAWNIGPGDAVFSPDFTYFASINCAMLRGATPVIVDIDPRTFNISSAALEKAIQLTIADGKLTPKVIIPVDLFGQPAEHVEIQHIADKYGLKIIEDAAQGFGGSINGRMACSFGDVASTSFFPAKPLGCYGDGGAIFTNDEQMAIKLRSLRAQGSSPADKYDNISIGLNSRLDTLQAAILLPKLKSFIEQELDEVNKVAERYDALLGNTVVRPLVKEGYRSSWAQYTILLKDKAQRDGLKDHLKQADIPSMIYYPRGMHQQTAIRGNYTIYSSFEVTESVVQHCLSLPMGPYLNKEDQKLISNVILKFVR